MTICRNAKQVVTAREQAVTASTHRQAAEAELGGLQAELRIQEKEQDRILEQQILVQQNCTRHALCALAFFLHILSL